MELGPVGILTDELIRKMISELETGHHKYKDTAIKFLTDKKDVLIGLATDALVKVLNEIGDNTYSLLAAKRAYINSLPFADAMVVFEKSVQELESSVQGPIRLGSVFVRIAEYGAQIAPALLSVVLKVI